MSQSRKFNTFLGIFSAVIISLTTSALNASVIVEINDLRPDRIKSAGFILSEDQDIRIEAYGLRPHPRFFRKPYTYAWILDAQTRDVVWQLSQAERDRVKKFEHSYEDKVFLKAGSYEIFYAIFPYFFQNEDTYYYEDGFGSFISHFFGVVFGDDRRDYRRVDFEKLFIRIDGAGKAIPEDELIARNNAVKNKALLSFTRLRGEEHREQVFRVNAETMVHIYAIGEARRDGLYDFGWITNLETRDRVWELDYRHSERAGGAAKNRLARQTLILKPGIYKVVFITDDSHHYNDWNSFPPFDPEFYGLTISTEDEKDSGNITLLDTTESIASDPVVKFNRVRDHEYRSRGFTLKKPLDLHILALGEGRDGEMFDYGWIVNVKTREKIWTMKFRETEPAGGADKNRLFDGIVRLEPGNYTAYYVTDGSHAYHSWNTSPPYDETLWGMTITVLDEQYTAGDIVPYSETEDPKVIAKIVRVRDDVRERQRFTLEKDSYVHVYAIGEGDRDEMYDYAYIENYDTGKMVWEMSYRNTDRAGGARKNRVFNDEIYLEKGTYFIFYRTDDSHSFEDWNDDPPYDPVNYGVTLTHPE